MLPVTGASVRFSSIPPSVTCDRCNCLFSSTQRYVTCDRCKCTFFLYPALYVTCDRCNCMFFLYSARNVTSDRCKCTVFLYPPSVSPVTGASVRFSSNPLSVLPVIGLLPVTGASVRFISNPPSVLPVIGASVRFSSNPLSVLPVIGASVRRTTTGTLVVVSRGWRWTNRVGKSGSAWTTPSVTWTLRGVSASWATSTTLDR